MADRAGSAAPTILSEPALEAWGRAVGEAAVAGSVALPLVVVLRGPLGAGKSVLARAVARGAGVDSPMPSPTYNLLFTYDTGGLVVHHLDLYRLEDPDDVWELGWDELGQGREVVLIEWPERAESLLPEDRWDVRLAFAEEDGAGEADDDAEADVAARGGVSSSVDDRRTVLVESRGDAPDPPPLPGSMPPPLPGSMPPGGVT